MDVAPVLGFFKFGSLAHIKQFVQGTLYMNTLDYFADAKRGLYCDIIPPHG